jgi:hypothetical protein
MREIERLETTLWKESIQSSLSTRLPFFTGVGHRALWGRLMFAGVRAHGLALCGQSIEIVVKFYDDLYGTEREWDAR